MGKIIFQIDDFIIAKLEKFAHKFQLWTGKNNFWLARLFWGLWCLSATTSLIGLKPSTTLTIVLICFVAFNNIMLVAQREKLFLERPNILNSEKILPLEKFIRVVFLAFTVFMEVTYWLGNKYAAELILNHCILFYTLALYFEALNPLPPGKIKIKELAKALAKILKSRVAVPAPEAAG